MTSSSDVVAVPVGAVAAGHDQVAQGERPDHIALSSDGGSLAFLRSSARGSELLSNPSSAGDGTVIASGLGETGGLAWSRDGRQLSYTENLYEDRATRVGLYDADSREWEIETLPFFAGHGSIVATRYEARSFFVDELVNEDRCPGPGNAYPSGREGACAFAFFTSDSPEGCADDGPVEVTVPDGVGLGLHEAAIRMQTVGLIVNGSGVPPGDPTDPGAVVRAQAPPAGEVVPLGACVGFRTGSP